MSRKILKKFFFIDKLVQFKYKKYLNSDYVKRYNFS